MKLGILDAFFLSQPLQSFYDYFTDAMLAMACQNTYAFKLSFPVSHSPSSRTHGLILIPHDNMLCVCSFSIMLVILFIRGTILLLNKNNSSYMKGSIELCLASD
ncbi:hypothetical protein D3C78_1508380 [compost metagenome]